MPGSVVAARWRTWQAADAAGEEACEPARHEGEILHAYQVLLPVLVIVVPEAQAMPEEPRIDTAERGVQNRPSNEAREQARQDSNDAIGHMHAPEDDGETCREEGRDELQGGVNGQAEKPLAMKPASMHDAGATFGL